MLGALLLIAVGLAALAGLATVALTRRIEARHPPVGRLVATPDGLIHLLVIGPAAAADRPRLVLIHGATLHLADMRAALADRLADTCSVIVPDRPGQGYSPAARDALSPLRQAARLRAAIGDGPVVLVGHSFGGLIALAWALAFPGEVAALVLINPTTHPRPGGLPWYQRLASLLFGPVLRPLLAWTMVLPASLLGLDRLATRLFRPEAPPPGFAARTALALALTPRRFLASLVEYATLRDETIALAPRYRDIRAPTLILAGTADPIVPPAIHAEALAQAMPNATLLRLAGAGHMAHHTHADEIANAIRAQLAALTPRSG